jgi:hypothetical protein
VISSRVHVGLGTMRGRTGCLCGAVTITFDLSNYPLALIFVVGLAAILVISEVGWQLGIHIKGRAGANFSTLESAMLGLLALMLAFTFAMALSRYEARRDAVLNEANAIGTTALRASRPAHRWPNSRRPSIARIRFRKRSGSRQEPWQP